MIIFPNPENEKNDGNRREFENGEGASVEPSGSTAAAGGGVPMQARYRLAACISMQVKISTSHQVNQKVKKNILFILGAKGQNTRSKTQKKNGLRSN